MYELGDVLGEGTFGTVFKCRLPQSLQHAQRSGDNEEYVAIKRIGGSRHTDIIKELDILHTLRGNTNVVELLSCTVTAETALLVFPLFEDAQPWKEYCSIMTVTEVTFFF
jgi:serine/threonine protein kinase